MSRSRSSRHSSRRNRSPSAASNVRGTKARPSRQESSSAWVRAPLLRDRPAAHTSHSTVHGQVEGLGLPWVGTGRPVRVAAVPYRSRSATLEAGRSRLTHRQLRRARLGSSRPAFCTHARGNNAAAQLDAGGLTSPCFTRAAALTYQWPCLASCRRRPSAGTTSAGMLCRPAVHPLPQAAPACGTSSV